MNGMKVFLLCALLILALALSAQTPQWEWAESVGGVSFDSAQSIALDSEGNQYVTGYFEGTASFGDHTLTSSGGADIFVAKLDPNGNWLWAVKAGGACDDYVYGIAVDGSGNAYLTGAFKYTATFGAQSLTSSGYYDIFAAKLDPNGNWLWAVKAGGADMDSGHSITVDSTGNAFLTGYFSSIASFGTHTITSSGYYDIFAAKLDPNGNWLWAVKAEGQTWTRGTASQWIPLVMPS